MINDPYHCTFIHIPKNAGNSVSDWMRQNFPTKTTKRKQHCDINTAYNLLGNLGWKFCVIRNPWDYAVSWYTFKIDAAKVRINMVKNNPSLANSHKEKYNVETQQQQIDRLEAEGFDGWLKRTSRGSQLLWAKNCDYWIRLENLSDDFKEVQTRLNCFESLGHSNKTRNRTSYKDYYTSQELIDIVADKWKDDVDAFRYDF